MSADGERYDATLALHEARARERQAQREVADLESLVRFLGLGGSLAEWRDRPTWLNAKDPS